MNISDSIKWHVCNNTQFTLYETEKLYMYAYNDEEYDENYNHCKSGFVFFIIL